MSQNRQLPVYQPSQARLATPLWSVVYRSWAAAPLSGYDLYELVQAAQSRNQVESITGLMVYDEGRFYQWLEGPADGVARVMKSITSDRRHAQVEILSDKPLASRQFGDWTMRLATRGVRSIHSIHNVIVPATQTLESLLSNPEAIPALLASFSPAPVPAPGRPTETGADLQTPPPSNGPLRGTAGALLRDVIVSAVFPELLARHRVSPLIGPWPTDARASALADLLVGPDTNAALELLRTLQDADGSVRNLYETLVEPAARGLGDLWRSDLCSEFDVTLALGQLQRVVRVLNEDAGLPLIPAGLFLPAVLIVPEPGEAHSLNAVLDSDALWQAGWDPQSEFPASDEALQDLMAGSWFDALDLSLSAAFRRDHWLPRVTKTIALARHASRNPGLVVVVAGRIFAEDATASTQVGADGTTTTALRAEQAIRALLPLGGGTLS